MGNYILYPEDKAFILYKLESKYTYRYGFDKPWYGIPVWKLPLKIAWYIFTLRWRHNYQKKLLPSSTELNRWIIDINKENRHRVMANFWKGKRVLVTGGSGFLGSHLVPMLQGVDAEVIAPRSTDCDLRDSDQTRRLYKTAGPLDMVFHLAATVGGIGANRQRPADFFYENTMMNCNVAHYARVYEVGKLVAVGTVCAYPKYTTTPFREENLWDGYPEETNAAYGIAKRAFLVYLQALRQQYGFNGIYLIPTNLYGPGDHSDPLTSHVIPALIRKIDDAQRAGLDTVEVWGTGGASRDFLYVADCAEALTLAAYRYNRGDPVNLGSGREVYIRELVDILISIMKFNGRIVYDPRYPDGQPKRVLNTRRAWDEFGWQASTRLEDGLRKTVEWWRANRG